MIFAYRWELARIDPGADLSIMQKLTVPSIQRRWTNFSAMPDNWVGPTELVPNTAPEVPAPLSRVSGSGVSGSGCKILTI